MNLENLVNNFWEIKTNHGIADVKKSGDIGVLSEVINLLDNGKICVVEKQNDKWIINEWIKRAILLYLGTTDSTVIKDCWYDKVAGKFDDWSINDFIQNKVRAVPGCFVRKGAFLSNGVIVMPSFINIGSHIGENTMIDSLVTVGSCVKIGANCHISSNTVLAGVIEPVQASPVIIEDDCFIGAGCQIAEGVIIEKGSVIAAGVTITGATKIVDRATGNISYGIIKEGSVVVGGSVLGEHGVSVNCAVVIKQVDEKTRKKTSLNDLIRV
jgi:2,3,4,5-tetrahydropyridine-2-carboxylate N-succinyltransferase